MLRIPAHGLHFHSLTSVEQFNLLQSKTLLALRLRFDIVAAPFEASWVDAFVESLDPFVFFLLTFSFVLE